METIYGPRMAMGDLFVRQPLPTNEIHSFDPFLLLHHGDVTFESGGSQDSVGVPPHPHRGFYPVSFVFSGAVHHRDSLGNDSVIHKGGVQWVSAGKGIVHSERPSKEIAEKGGRMELIQLWINTPSAHKLNAPEYIGLQREEIPAIEYEHGILTLVSGVWNGQKGALQPPFDLNAAMLFTSDAQELEIETIGQKQLIYVLEGEIDINGEKIEEHFMGITEGEAKMNVTTKGKTKALILSADPINEPVVSHGPFVMTNNREIYQAIEDFQNGKMGRLVEDFD